jgi:hypothetical protein
VTKPASTTVPNGLSGAIEAVTEAGYVVLKAKSYRQAQERQRVAEAMRRAEEDAAESARAWARDCIAQERHLRDRLTFVYGVARAHGATVEDLDGGTCTCGLASCVVPAPRPCFCGKPGDRERVHRAHACEPWRTLAKPDPGASP